MRKDTRGAWVIHHANKLHMLQTQDGYENLHSVGRTGILLSAISASNQMSMSLDRVTALATAAKINTKLELPVLLDKLEEARLIDKTGIGIEVLGVTTLSTLSHTSDLFEFEEPNNQERAAIYLAEESSTKPILQSEIGEVIADRFEMSRSGLIDFFDVINSSGMVDRESFNKSESLYFNGNLFRSDSIEKTYKVVSSLTAPEQAALQELDTIFSSNACISLDKAKKILGEKLFEKLVSVSFYDINIVNNSNGDFAFITKPSSFSKYSRPQTEDAFDNAKALVTSLTYGMTKSHYARGQITMIDKLLGKLIQGGSVGPVTAIGEDYKALEQRGVVKVDKVAGRFGGSSYQMRLLKKDVGELALKVMETQDISDQSLSNFPEASVYSYTGPERNRENVRKKQNDISKNTAFRILDVLRDSQ